MLFASLSDLNQILVNIKVSRNQTSTGPITTPITTSVFFFPCTVGLNIYIPFIKKFSVAGGGYETFYHLFWGGTKPSSTLTGGLQIL